MPPGLDHASIQSALILHHTMPRRIRAKPERVNAAVQATFCAFHIWHGPSSETLLALDLRSQQIMGKVSIRPVGFLSIFLSRAVTQSICSNAAEWIRLFQSSQAIKQVGSFSSKASWPDCEARSISREVVLTRLVSRAQ